MGPDLFSIGKSSLRSSKKQLSTTSHNIANVNTEGYSRQIATTHTNTPVQVGKNVMGNGVSIQSVRRVHDDLIEKNLNNSMTNHSYNEEKSFQLSRVEEVFNEMNSDGLNKVLNRFFNAFRELSNQPENEVVRSLVRDNANLVVKDFNRINETITDLKHHVDRSIEASVEDINSLANNISKLNREIVRLENSGGETGDLRDQRDGAVRSLAEYFKVHTYEDNKGEFVVNIVGAGSLVAGGSVNEIEAGKTSAELKGLYSGEGRSEIFFKKKGNLPITGQLKAGKIGALMHTRNAHILDLRANLDEIAYGISKATNAIHERGYANKKLEQDQNGNYISDSSMGPIQGISFFNNLESKEGASAKIDLSDDIKNDLNNISTGLEPNSPGDNRIAIAISKLQHEKVLSGGSSTFEESYLSSVGKIGLASKKTNIDLEQSGGILAQSKSIKERLSGVSLDEETANMVKYQHAYDASARMIRTADEMFDSVLSMIG